MLQSCILFSLCYHRFFFIFLIVRSYPPTHRLATLISDRASVWIENTTWAADWSSHPLTWPAKWNVLQIETRITVEFWRIGRTVTARSFIGFSFNHVSHRTTLGLQSGELCNQIVVVMWLREFSHSKHLVLLLVWHGAESCCNTPGLPVATLQASSTLSNYLM